MKEERWVVVSIANTGVEWGPVKEFLEEKYPEGVNTLLQWDAGVKGILGGGGYGIGKTGVIEFMSRREVGERKEEGWSIITREEIVYRSNLKKDSGMKEEKEEKRKIKQTREEKEDILKKE